MTINTKFNDGILTVSGDGVVPFFKGEKDLAFSIKDVKEVVVEEGVRGLCEGAFWDFINMTSITLPSTITEIPSNTFVECKSLAKVDFPYIKQVGMCAFNSCNSLKELNMENAQRIGNSLFLGCDNLTKINGIEVGEFLTLNGALVEYRGKPTEDTLVIPSFVNGFTYDGFQDLASCKNLKKIVLQGEELDMKELIKEIIERR